MSLDRRKFLSLSMGGTAAFASGGLAWLGVQRRAAEVNVTRRAWALGSDVSMTVIGLPMDRAEQALDAAFAELELVEEVLSLYRPGSQIRRLNRDRVLEQPHPYFLAVLEKSPLASIARSSSIRRSRTRPPRSSPSKA